MKSNKVLGSRAFSRRDFLKLSGVGIAGAALTGAVGCGSPAGGDDEVQEFRFAYEGPEGTTQGIAANIFQETLEEVSDGQMVINQFPGGQLGGEPELLEQLRAGEIAFVNSSTANAAQIASQSGVFSLHYLFEGREHNERALTDPEVVEAYRDLVRDSVEGVRVLTLYTLPLRHMYSSDIEVRSVDDIQGRSIRVQATRTEDVTFEAYGANTVHMAFPEVYSALQTGVVDMAENALTYYGVNNHYEVAPVMSMTEHAGNTQVIWVTEEEWNNLSDEQQEWVQEAADAVNSQAIQRGFELEDELREEYEEQGVQFIDDIDRQSFIEVAEPLQDELASDLGPHAERIVELVRGLR